MLAGVFVATPPASASATTFAFTGSAQTFVVPAGVHQIQVEACGAEGGDGSETGGQGALGGCTMATITTTPGESLLVNVGGQGASTVDVTGGS
ncbi:MAG: hypothetical protein ACRDHB_01320, partial [Actinomycetota bacterium]